MDSSLTQQAYELIKEQIITCNLAPGVQIAQRPLAERFGTGLTPMREALQRLAQQGFVQAVPRFGYIVSPIAISDVREIFELRAILETGAVRLAAAHASDEQLAGIAQAAHFTYTYRDRQSYRDFLSANARFHRSLAEAAGNQRLAEQVDRVLDELLRVFHLGLDLRDSAEEMCNEHMDLAGALLARDALQAEQVMLQQITRSQQRVLETLLQPPGGGALSRTLQINRPTPTRGKSTRSQP
jgi:DNA-binding GntR family transcriptional regulator